MKHAIGDTYWFWTVIGIDGHAVRVKCACSAVRLIPGSRFGLSKSCGCKKADLCGANSRKHGHTTGGIRSGEHVCWMQMLARCHNPRSNEWQHYGGRGIAVCQRWRDSFESFLADMGGRPSRAHSIDRIDNTLGYEPGNCRWATRTEQNRNKRTNRFLSIGGVRKTIAEWSEVSGLSRDTIKSRLSYGWKESDVLRPVARGKRYVHEVDHG